MDRTSTPAPRTKVAALQSAPPARELSGKMTSLHGIMAEQVRDHARGAEVTPAKTIGVLTSGGDCAGLNAVIRAVVCHAVLGYGWRVLGIRQGTQGLLRRPVDFEPLDLHGASPAMARMAGTILGTTNRGDPFAYPMSDGTHKDRSEEVIEGGFACSALTG
jgi:hypothetical protein